MSNVIEFRSRKQLAITRIHTAPQDIADILQARVEQAAGMGCIHNNVTVASQNGRVVWFCNECKKVLHK